MPEIIHLQVDRGPAAGQMYSIPADGATLGRSSVCTIPIEDGKLSRHHCRFLFRANKLHVTDMDSSNGTVVNGATIQEETRLNPGDQILVGDSVILVIYDDLKPPLRVAQESAAASAQRATATVATERAKASLWVRLPVSLLLVFWFLMLAFSLLPRGEQGTGIATAANRPGMTPTRGGASGGGLSGQPPSSTSGSPAAQGQNEPASSSMGADEVAGRARLIEKTVAACLVEGQYERALALIRREKNQPAGAALQDRCAELEQRVRGAVASLSGLEDAILKFSGKEVTIEYNGRRLTVVPRASVNGRVTFAVATPTGTQYVSIRTRDMSPADQLQFLGPPDTKDKALLSCALLLQAERLKEAKEAAASCGPLAGAMTELAGG
jgi:hypothetical protein